MALWIHWLNVLGSFLEFLSSHVLFTLAQLPVLLGLYGPHDRAAHVSESGPSRADEADAHHHSVHRCRRSCAEGCFCSVVILDYLELLFGRADGRHAPCCGTTHPIG
jgi:hypothetical protein